MFDGRRVGLGKGTWIETSTWVQWNAARHLHETGQWRNQFQCYMCFMFTCSSAELMRIAMQEQHLYKCYAIAMNAHIIKIKMSIQKLTQNALMIYRLLVRLRSHTFAYLLSSFNSSSATLFNQARSLHTCLDGPSTQKIALTSTQSQLTLSKKRHFILPGVYQSHCCKELMTMWYHLCRPVVASLSL